MTGNELYVKVQLQYSKHNAIEGYSKQSWPQTASTMP